MGVAAIEKWVPFAMPFARKTADELFAIAVDALDEGDRSTVDACIRELRDKRSTRKAARFAVELEEMLLPDLGPVVSDAPEPAPAWLAGVAKVAGGLRPSTAGTCSVYLVLLWNFRKSGAHALYVGQTACTPADRFEQHRTGYKSARAVKNCGVRLIDLPHLAGISREEALDLEEQLAEALREGGFEVFGGH